MSRQDLPAPDQALSKEFRDYAYGVSHDLSAPIRAMVEFSRILSSEHAPALNDEGRLYLSLIVESGERAQKMMAGLLDYSRLNTEGRPFGLVDCNMVMENTLLTFADRIKSAHALIDCETLPEIHADAAQIGQLFMALLDNALKFQPPGQKPVVWVSARRQGGDWMFSVSDNGIGLDKRYGEKIFRIFQRLHVDEDYPGVGVGLTIAQKIINRHGGRLWVESVPGRGAAFFFTIPAEGDA